MNIQTIALTAILGTTLCLAQTVQPFAGVIPIGDGGPASAAMFSFPQALAFDAAGNLFIADSYNGRIRKVTPDGNITTVAGNGTFGYSGDGGPAPQAQFSFYTISMAIDPAGNIYISDAANAAVRKIGTDGNIRTILTTAAVPGASATSPFYPGALALDTSGALYVTDMKNPQVLKLAADGTATRIAGSGKPADNTVSGPATATNFSLPGGLFVDPTGNVFVSDMNEGAIFKITPAGTLSIFSQPALPENLGFAMIWSLRQDATGNIFALDQISSQVTKVTPDGNASPFAGKNNLDNLSGGDGGPATAALIFGPLDIALSPAGDIYIADSNSQVRVVSAADGTIRSPMGAFHYAGDGGPASQAVFAEPGPIASDKAGNLYVAEVNGFRVRRIAPDGTVTTIAGNGQNGFSGDGGAATAAQIDHPLALATDAAGNIYISANNRVRRVTPDGTISTVAGGGTSYSDNVPATTAKLLMPGGLAVDASGNVLISDLAGYVKKVGADGKLTIIAGNSLYFDGGDEKPAKTVSLSGTAGILADASGNIYICDAAHYRVRKITPDGMIHAFAGVPLKYGDTGDGGPATAALLSNPTSLAADTAGNIYIADQDSKKIRVVTTDGIIHTVASGVTDLGSVTTILVNNGFALYSHQYDELHLAIDPSGKLYVADQYRERIQVVAPAN